jgi:predicted transcriptional regulator of viral defense system
MPRKNILVSIKEMRRPIFTTYELTARSGKSVSTVVQSLRFLEKQGLVVNLYRGIWAEAGDQRVSTFTIIPYLFPRHRVYLSFISALHLYGIIEQIPQQVTLASTGHTRTIVTRLGAFSIHQISPLFFKGFDWYRKSGPFLIAEPEKALVDSLYLSARKKKQFGYFPELHLPKTFSIKKAKAWVRQIPQKNIRVYVQKKLAALLGGS